MPCFDAHCDVPRGLFSRGPLLSPSSSTVRSSLKKQPRNRASPDVPHQARDFALDLRYLSLTPGAKYALRITTTVGAYADIQLKIGFPPSGGACSTSPITAEAMLQLVTCTCSGWGGEDLPLRFSFALVLSREATVGGEAWSQVGPLGVIRPHLQHENRGLSRSIARPSLTEIPLR